jgi:hypothetical protein
MQLPAVRAEIEHMRRQIHRQGREIRDLQRAGISTVSAEELLARMLNKVDDLCAQPGGRTRRGAQKISGHKQSHQWTDRAALPVSRWLNDRVRCRGQKAINKVINKVKSRDWFRLGPAEPWRKSPTSWRCPSSLPTMGLQPANRSMLQFDRGRHARRGFIAQIWTYRRSASTVSAFEQISSLQLVFGLSLRQTAV